MFEPEEEEKEEVEKHCLNCGGEFKGPTGERSECPNCGSLKVHKMGE